MAYQYRRPPIVEATFECRFAASEGWTFASPSTIYNLVHPVYPSEPTIIANSNLELAADTGEVKASVRMLPQDQRFQFSTTDGHHLIRVGRDVISVHVMPPYPGWTEFRERIKAALDAYLQVVKPSSIERLSIRYVNRIELGTDPLDLNNYFRVPLEPPEGLGFSLTSFFLRLEGTRPDGVKLIQSFGSAPGDVVAIILDLDVIRDVSAPAVLEDDLLATIDSLREVERSAFEASITDKLREIFDADSD
jgi:uncharacterized protein (TIGR04255 family)